LCAASFAVEPTAAEQYMLSVINRARANPPAEAQRLLLMLQTNPDLRGAAATTDASGFVAQMSNLPQLPPLAFNTRLIEAAHDHDLAMLAANAQQHSARGFLTNPSVATASDGQPYFPTGDSAWATGENIFAYSQSVTQPSPKSDVDFFEAGLLLDWGNPDFGHLRNLMAPEVGEMTSIPHVPFNQVGIGLLIGVQPGAAGALNVGPAILTQEFAWRAGAQFLTGDVYRDDDQDGAYSIGEGVGGVTIVATGQAGQGTFQTITWSSGGYSLELPPGPYALASTSPQSGGHTASVVIAADNSEWDIVIPASAPPPPLVVAPPMTIPTPQPPVSRVPEASSVSRSRPAKHKPIVQHASARARQTKLRVTTAAHPQSKAPQTFIAKSKETRSGAAK
jgi:uncharacterized protein YkwD